MPSYLALAMIGGFGVLLAAGAISRRIDEVVGGLFATITFGAFAIGSTNIVTTTSCCQFVEQNNAMALVGLAAAGVMLVFTLKPTIIAADPRGTDLERGGRE